MSDKKKPNETKVVVAKGFESHAAMLERQAPYFGLADYAMRLAALQYRRRALLFHGVSDSDIRGAEAQAK